MANMAVGITRLASAMQTMKNVDTVVFTRLAKNIEKLSSIKSSDLTNAAISINRISKSVSSLSSTNITAGADKIGELSKGIAKLGYTSSSKAIENIPKLAKAMRELMATLSTAPKVNQNLIDMTNALANLSRTGASSGRAASSLSGAVNTYSTSSRKATKHTFSLAGAIGKLYASYWLLFRAMGKVKQSIDIAADIAEVQNVVNQTFGEYASLVDKASQSSIADFGMSELTLKQIASRFQAMGTAMGFTQGKMANMSLALTELAADMASFYNVEQEDVAKDLESIFTGETRPLRTFGLDLTEATLKEWAMKEGLDANISSMSQAEKAMLRYNYVMANTGAAQGDFARTAGSWSNQVRILRQNFEQLGSVLGGTLINALNPLIRAFNTAMGVIIAFAETISNALGKIFGWKFQRSGAGVTDSLTEGLDGVGDSADNAAGNLGGATSAAKELKRELLGFDEITKLSDVTDPSGGGSGGSGSGTSGAGADSGAGGEWTKVDTIFEDYKSNIDSLYELGHYISSTLQEAMDNIDWPAIKKKSAKIGKELANFLNGGIYPAIGSSTGRTVAEAINTALTGMHSFGITFNWKELGRTMAASLRSFFMTVDLNLAADTFETYANGILDALIIAVDEADWDSFGLKVGTALERIDWIKLMGKVALLLWKALKNAILSYNNMFTAAPIETTILTAIMLLKFTGLKGWVGKTIWGMISTALTGSAAKNTADRAATTMGEMLVESIKTKINTSTLVNRGASAILPFLSSAVAKAGELFQAAGGIGSPLGVLAFDDIRQTMKNNWMEFIDWLGGKEVTSYTVERWKKNTQKELDGEDLKANAEIELQTKAKDVMKKVAQRYKDIFIGLAAKITTDAPVVQDMADKLLEGYMLGVDAEIETPAPVLQFDLMSKFNGLTIGVDAEANLKNINQSLLTTGQKMLEMTGLLTSTDKSQLTSSQKQINTAAVFTSVNKSNLTDSEKSINTTANYTSSKDGLSSSEKTISNVAATVTKLYKASGLQLVMEAVVNFISNGLKLLFKADGGLFKNGRWSPIEQFAGGGLPNMGELFIARESGPELVGRMGGGTAVMNNNQIVASVSAGVYQAVAAAMSQFSGNSVSEIHVHLEGDAAGVFRMVKQENDRIVVATGEPALLI